ncbi:MAG: hypothetical protein AB7G80_05890 [Dongiaceae bacterium]
MMNISGIHKIGIKGALGVIAALILPHIPCLLIASGIFAASAGVAAFFSNPLAITGIGLAGGGLSLFVYRQVCWWRCNLDETKSFTFRRRRPVPLTLEQLLDKARTVKFIEPPTRRSLIAASALISGGVLLAGGAGIQTALSPARISWQELENCERVIFTSPDQKAGIIAVAAADKVLFFDSKNFGAESFEQCGGAFHLWIPFKHPSFGATPLPEAEAGAKIMSWKTSYEKVSPESASLIQAAAEKAIQAAIAQYLSGRQAQKNR